MNYTKLSDYKLDYARTISKQNGIIFYVAFVDESFYKYYHSKEKTENFKCLILVYSGTTNEIINSIPFNISKYDWEKFNNTGKGTVDLLYCPINNALLLIQDTIDFKSKIIHIVFCKNIEKEVDENGFQTAEYLSEARLLTKNYNQNSLKIYSSNLGKITLSFKESELNQESFFDILNISDLDYSESIMKSIFNDLEANGEDLYREYENQKADKEISKFHNNYNFYEPYKFFTEDEWDIILNRFPSKFFNPNINFVFNEIVRKYSGKIHFDNQNIKESILKNLEERFNMDKKKSEEFDDNYNHNDWLRDASGTSDPETQNDVYWNLD